jgi:hypothetical protein
MVGEVKKGLRLVNTLMRPPFTLNENKLSALNADTLDRMAKDHGVTMLPVREAIVALAFELGVNDVQVARKHALSFMDGFRLPEVQELYDQHVIDHDFYRALAIEVSDCAKRQQESVARALQKQKEDEKAKEMLRKKQESEKKLNDAINDALKKNRERLSEEHSKNFRPKVISKFSNVRTIARNICCYPRKSLRGTSKFLRVGGYRIHGAHALHTDGPRTAVFDQRFNFPDAS